MASTIAEIKALIVTRVAGLEHGSGFPIFKEVHEAPGQQGEFPSALILAVGGEGEVGDTHRNERTFRYEVRGYCAMPAEGGFTGASNELLAEAADALLAMFDRDRNLGEEVSRVRVVGYACDFTPVAGTWEFFTMTVEAVAFVPSFG